MQDESRMRSVAQMYSQYSGAPSRRVSSAFHTLQPLQTNLGCPPLAFGTCHEQRSG